jgi:hypothetical protein
MSVFLLDVNVLIALSWPPHESHQRTHRWFSRHPTLRWATCPFTQTAFVRILSNPAFSSHAVSPREAIQLLEGNLRHPGHRFWADEIGLVEAVRHFKERLNGHRQVTDTYLLGLALHKKGRLATLDESILTMLPKSDPDRSYVEIISHTS